MAEENEGGEALRASTDPSDRLTPHMLRHAAHSCCNEHGKSILRAR